MTRATLALVFGAFLGAFLGASARAQQPPAAARARPPRFDPVVDGAVAATAAAGWLALALARDNLVRTSCPCERAGVNPLDRPAAGARGHGGELAADVTLALALALPLGGLAALAPDGRAFAEDALLVCQSALAAGQRRHAARAPPPPPYPYKNRHTPTPPKAAAARPYPYMNGQTPSPEQQDDPANYESFWSGHTAVPMAAAVTFAYVAARRRPGSPWRFVAWIIAPALAIAAGTMQVAAGNHYPSDVAAGAAAGAAVGWLNSHFHEW